jgi:hypothetical protein
MYFSVMMSLNVTLELAGTPCDAPSALNAASAMLCCPVATRPPL